MVKRIKSKPKRAPNGRQNAINMRLRRDILDGILQPGSRLPTRIELQKEYKTTPVTVQRALDKMEADGFIRSEGRRGTFVTEYPPCHSRYAIVFPFNIFSEKKEGTFYQVLGRLAESKNREDGVDFSLYMGLNGHTDEPDYKRLLKDLNSLRLTGIIFASSPHAIRNTPLFKEILARKDLPKVAFMSEAAYPEIQSISNEADDFLRSSLDLFRRRRCRRLAVLGAGEGDDPLYHEAELPAEAERMGMELKPEWMQLMHFHLASRARNLVRLLLQGKRDKRPDALLIWDSVFAEAAMKGIEELGLDPAKDIAVVSHCNFPEPPAVTAPITFIGFNVEVFLDTCLKLMRKQRQGSLKPPLTSIPLEVRESTTETQRHKGEVVGSRIGKVESRI